MVKASAALKSFTAAAKSCGMTLMEAEAAFKAMSSALNGKPEPKEHPLVLAVREVTKGKRR